MFYFIYNLVHVGLEYTVVESQEVYCHRIQGTFDQVQCYAPKGFCLLPGTFIDSKWPQVKNEVAAQTINSEVKFSENHTYLELERTLEILWPTIRHSMFRGILIPPDSPFK